MNALRLFFIVTLFSVCSATAQTIHFKKSQKKTTEQSTSEKQEDASSLYVSGCNYQTKGDFANALKYFEKSRTTADKTNNTKDIVLASFKLAEVYDQTQKSSKAIKELEYALKKSIASKNDLLTERSYENLYNLNLKIGNEKKATEYYGIFKTFKTNRENRE